MSTSPADASPTRDLSLSLDHTSCLTPEELSALGARLESSTHPSDSMDLIELHGFLTAIGSGPSPIMPSAWLPSVYGEDETFTQSEEGLATNEIVVRLFNQVCQALKEGAIFEPLAPPTRDEAPRWAQGYVAGARLDQRWRSDDMGTALLFPLGVLAKVFNLTGQLDENDEAIVDQTEHETQYFHDLREAVVTLYNYWRRRRSDAARPKRRLVRGPSCLCGSGHPFDRCCGRMRIS